MNKKQLLSLGIGIIVACIIFYLLIQESIRYEKIVQVKKEIEG
jgi:hypothetical protein